MEDTEDGQHQDTEADERIIRESCLAIARLWKTAELVTDHQANPAHERGGHDTSPSSRPPLSLTGTQTLADTQGWMLEAMTAAHFGRTRAFLALEARPALCAAWLADNSRRLAAQPDAGDWARDAFTHARRIKRICGETSPDPTTWRAVLVDWRPEEIAGILTQLTGQPVHADRVRHTLLDGRVTLTRGRVSLGEVADAMRLTGLAGDRNSR